MSEQDGTKALALQRPVSNDIKAWRTYWKAQNQPWRTEPEIDAERQKYLTDRRRIMPDIEQGVYSFKGIKLNRADVEWLLATHENGRGPVDWNDQTQHARDGVDLRGANISDIDLSELPLARLQGGLTGRDWDYATGKQRRMAAIHLERTILTYTHLEGSILTHAQLQGARLNAAHLESVDAFGASFDAPVPANFRGAYFDSSTKFERAKIANEQHVGIRLIDVHWGDVNLTGVDWSSVKTLFDEHRARNPTTIDGKEKDKWEFLRHYQEAVRAYHQLAQVLRQQGINDDAARFAYRAQYLQLEVLRRQQKFGKYLFSLFLNLLAGYGYKPWRSFLAYLIVITAFATAYFVIGRTAGPSLSPIESFVYSMTSFHGRGFFPGGVPLDDPLTILAAIEAFVGLLVEVTFIATLTRRLFG